MTPAAFLALLLLAVPTKDPAELQRYDVIAQAGATVEAEFAPRWKRPRRELAPAMVTAMYFNGHFARDIHSGERLGSGGARCMMDIDPGNPLWKRHAEHFEDLTGLDLESTTTCLRVGTETLVLSLGHCLGKHYFTNWREAMWTSYATGSKCWLHKSAFARARFMRRLVANSKKATQ